jgi:hypothetical protein
LGNKGCREYLRGIDERYQEARRKAKKVNLDECENIGYYRKYAIRLLSGRPPESSYSYLSHSVTAERFD